jgi:hypothetical protein
MCGIFFDYIIRRIIAEIKQEQFNDIRIKNQIKYIDGSYLTCSFVELKLSCCDFSSLDRRLRLEETFLKLSTLLYTFVINVTKKSK